MNAPVKPQLIHIGPIRQESENLLKQFALPSLVITPMPEPPTLKGMQNTLKHVSAMVSLKAGRATGYSYNVPGFDSLSPASGLKSLYPGIAETQRKPVETRLLNELISEHCSSGTLITHLVLEQPEQTLLLLQAWQAEGLLVNLKALYVRTSPVSLYEGMPTRAELIAWCQQYGFDTRAEKIDRDSSEDPEFILLEFKRNALHVPLKAAQEKVDTLQKECDSLKKTISEYEKLLKENANQLSKAAAALRETDTQLKQSTKQHDKKSLQAEKANEECAILKQQLSEKESTITQLREQLASQQQSQTVIQSRFEVLESKLESLLGEQRSYIQQTSNALGQHVTRMSYEQRNLLALSHYLKHGQRLVNSELDSGYALALLEQYHSQSYDVVVVFGSVATTELLAKVEVNSYGRESQLMLESMHDDMVTPSEYDLPTSIISIEHQKKLCKELKERLEVSRCSQVVSVVNAPWIEYKCAGEITLFYSAEATLKRLGQCLPEEAKVLVIIGTTLAQTGYSRQAALMPLIQNLPTQTLDIIVEKTTFPQEAKMKNIWESKLKVQQRNVNWYEFIYGLSLRICFD